LQVVSIDIPANQKILTSKFKGFLLKDRNRNHWQVVSIEISANQKTWSSMK